MILWTFTKPSATWRSSGGLEGIVLSVIVTLVASYLHFAIYLFPRLCFLIKQFSTVIVLPPSSTRPLSWKLLCSSIFCNIVVFCFVWKEISPAILASLCNCTEKFRYDLNSLSNVAVPMHSLWTNGLSLDRLLNLGVGVLSNYTKIPASMVLIVVSIIIQTHLFA